MTFSSVEFALFLPLVLIGYWLMPRRAGAQNGFILLASYAFYATWSVRLLPLILATTLVDWLVTRHLARHEDQRRRRAALIASLVWNLGLLGFFKYVGFFASSLHELTGIPLPALEIALPVGISYYTLQKLGYVIDVYYRRIPPCDSLLTFATFVAFFPQLVAGPISRGGQLLPQLGRARGLTGEQLRAAAGAFFLGFVLKAYVADNLARLVVDPVFEDPRSFSALGHWTALLGYAAQVFGDFAGYSLMAIGVARMLGIELPANFNYPFLAKGLLDFWRRWHITLNQWLFEYIYTPLTTGTGFFRGRLSLGFVIVFLASGIWHGAAWGFVLWGLLHGVGLIVNHRWDEYYRGLCRKDRVWVARRKSLPYGAVAWALTQAFFVLTLIPFRAGTLTASGEFARGLLGSPGERVLAQASSTTLLALLGSIAFLGAYHLLELKRLQPLRARFFALPDPLRGVAYGLFVVYLFMFVPVAGGTFIYARF